ncbi:sodium-dependent multivitamin transporter-like [Haliotis rufescens]|uniref:sodium-dependent multivitamin transporter-like n=1 Tax=Haliotis rufescens TaxID=6454 RepID=UPI00201ECB41|nr:sodium-dependent multivitamin transporter-like [Haliotis rufescens]
MNSFSIVDYVVFGATILMSLGIGLYFALSGGRQRSTSEFLVGGRNMQIIPVALSLVVSFESSIMILGIPAEVYVYGAQVFYMGIVVFGTAIGLEEVTVRLTQMPGNPKQCSIIPFIVLLHVQFLQLHGPLGGIKAIVWTDVFQTFIMTLGILVIVIKILPILTVDIFKGIPGMFGLFVAALCSASVSTISSGLSSLAATTSEDILKHHLPNLSDFKATLVAKVAGRMLRTHINQGFPFTKNKRG